MPDSVELIARHSHLVTGTYKNLLLFLHRGQARPEDAREIESLYRRFSREFPRGYVALVVVEGGTPLPSDEQRETFVAMMSRFGPPLCGLAGVFEAQGFVAAAMRSVMSAIALLVRARYPRKIFGSTGEAARWLTGQLGAAPGTALPVDEIEYAFAQFRTAATRAPGPASFGARGDATPRK